LAFALAVILLASPAAAGNRGGYHGGGYYGGRRAFYGNHGRGYGYGYRGYGWREVTGTAGMVTLGGSGFRQLCQCLTTADGKACQWVNPFSQLKSSREAEHQESTLRRKQTQIQVVATRLQYKADTLI